MKHASRLSLYLELQHSWSPAYPHLRKSSRSKDERDRDRNIERRERREREKREKKEISREKKWMDLGK